MTILLTSRRDYERVRQLHDLLNHVAASEYIMDANEPIVQILLAMAFWLDGYRVNRSTYHECVHLMSRAIEVLESYSEYVDTRGIWDDGGNDDTRQF